MSLNRENVTWQSSNGKWNIGFWEFHATSSWDDPDYDHEWDVEYRNDAFWFASRGHATPEAAYEAYLRHHANPGGTWIISYSDTTAAEIAQYEKYADKATSR